MIERHLGRVNKNDHIGFIGMHIVRYHISSCARVVIHLCDDEVIHKHIVLWITAERIRTVDTVNHSNPYLSMLNAWRCLVHTGRYLVR